MSVPFEINVAPPEVNKKLMSLFTGETKGYLQVGPKKYLLTSEYGKQAAGCYNMEVRPDDVWVITFPRSGTTWTQELVWLITHDLDYKKGSEKKLNERCLFLDSSITPSEEYKREVIKLNQMDEKAEKEFLHKLRPGYEKAEEMKSPRHIKSHLPLSLLPPKLLDTCKVVYVARNPKDVAVSFYYFSKLLREFGCQVDFKQYWELFQNDKILWTPFWSHVQEAWEVRNHSNMLFLFYEDMKKDLKSTVLKVADFFNKSIRDEEIPQLISHLSFANFSKNPALEQLPYCQKGILNSGGKGVFYRKGQTGDWKGEFTAEMTVKADEWIKEHEKDTDLRFQFE